MRAPRSHRGGQGFESPQVHFLSFTLRVACLPVSQSHGCIHPARKISLPPGRNIAYLRGTAVCIDPVTRQAVPPGAMIGVSGYVDHLQGSDGTVYAVQKVWSNYDSRPVAFPE